MYLCHSVLQIYLQIKMFYKCGQCWSVGAMWLLHIKNRPVTCSTLLPCYTHPWYLSITIQSYSNQDCNIALLSWRAHLPLFPHHDGENRIDTNNTSDDNEKSHHKSWDTIEQHSAPATRPATSSIYWWRRIWRSTNTTTRLLWRSSTPTTSTSFSNRSTSIARHSSSTTVWI